MKTTSRRLVPTACFHVLAAPERRRRESCAQAKEGATSRHEDERPAEGEGASRPAGDLGSR
jgi:hypothetical protein